jgi:hypothetical protein
MPADAASTSDGLYRSFLAAYLSFWRFLLTPEDAEVEESFKTAVRNALAAAAHDEAAGNPDAALFKACSYLFLSLSELESGGKVQAMYWLVAGIQEARKIAETYPNADPYLIVGCYDFYLSGEKADFRKMLGKAARDGFYFRDLASFIEGKLLQKRDSDWAASEALFRGLHTRYPANPLFSYHLAVSLRHLDRYGRALPCTTSPSRTRRRSRSPRNFSARPFLEGPDPRTLPQGRQGRNCLLRTGSALPRTVW